MAVLNADLTITVQKSADGKMYKTVLGKHAPYDSPEEVLASVPPTRRHIGQVFCVTDGVGLSDYHFVGGIEDLNLVIKPVGEKGDMGDKGDPGGTPLVTVTKADADALIAAGTLVPGQQYLISDFQTVHYIVDGTSVQYLDSIITGEVEPIIVTAVTATAFSKEAKSTTYPKDILHIDLSPERFLNDPAFADITTDAANPVIVPGFKGAVTFRHDTVFDNSMGYDFRNCKFRRWKDAVAVWDSATVYNEADWVKVDGILYTSLRESNTGNNPEPILSPSWVRAINTQDREYFLTKSNVYAGLIVSDTEFTDYKTFVEVEGASYAAGDFRGNNFRPNEDDNLWYWGYGCMLLNNVFFGQQNNYNRFQELCYGNTFFGNFNNNTGADYVTDNIFGVSCSSLSFGDASGCIFFGNSFSNSLSQRFNHNILGYGFGGNTTAPNFSFNMIGYGCYNNSFGAGASSSRIGNNFKSNTVGREFSGRIGEQCDNNTFLDFVRGNFLLSTKLSSGASCIIANRVDGTPRITYYDNTDTLQISAIDV